ncbi:MAG: GNAT family N-acetyltransferase [Chloroflexi bacterium HGW-Chloroflexi-4]|jgi:RimJ/RimL family protein N-acetyltransferase|nr:MAG: GNAT family N-acetyltransferase [Chloroflexi bacterium HGW-Chloroflexi-4]
MIETERLFIRRFKPTDAADLFEYLSLPEIYRFEPGEPVSMDEAVTLTAERAEGDNFLAVVVKASGKMIGHLYFEQRQPSDFRTWELGYIFNPAFQGKGYGSEASAALVDYAFANIHPHRIMARCDQKNPASWKLLEKIGFTREGAFKQVAYFRTDEAGNPIWVDAFEYSKLEQGH